MCWLTKLFSKDESTPNRTSEPIGKRLVLKELQTALVNQYDNADALDDKLKTLLSSASLILSIVTTLQITTGIERIGAAYGLGLVLVLTLYVFMIVVIVWGLRPKIYQLPIPCSWEEIAERYFGLSESSALSTLISTYLKALDENEKPLNRKSKAVDIALVSLVVIVVVLIGMSIIVWSTNGAMLTGPQSPLPTPTLVP